MYKSCHISHIFPFRMNESMSHIRICHVTRMNESCTCRSHVTYNTSSLPKWMGHVTYKWVMSHVCMSHVPRLNKSHVTHLLLLFCRPRSWTLWSLPPGLVSFGRKYVNQSLQNEPIKKKMSQYSHMWHVARVNESYHVCEWVTSQVSISHVTYVNESSHAGDAKEWVTLQVWISHVAHVNEPSEPLSWVLCHFTGVLDWFDVNLSARPASSFRVTCAMSIVCMWMSRLSTELLKNNKCVLVVGTVPLHKVRSNWSRSKCSPSFLVPVIFVLSIVFMRGMACHDSNLEQKSLTSQFISLRKVCNFVWLFTHVWVNRVTPWMFESRMGEPCHTPWYLWQKSPISVAAF